MGKAVFAETYSILHFPSTLEVVGGASLFSVKEIYLTEGTAPDLGEALTFWKRKKAEDKKSYMKIPLWRNCILHISSRRGVPVINLSLPQTLSERGKKLFARFWANSPFSWVRLTEMMEEIKGNLEKGRFALSLLRAYPDDEEADASLIHPQVF